MSLHDLSKDISERTDLSKEHPDVVKKLQGEWSAWYKSVGGKPRKETPAKDVEDAP